MSLRLLPFLALLLLAFFAGCASPEPYNYRYVPGKTAVLRDGYAVAPPSAPPAVQAAIAAGNRISGLPYAYGGGHGRGIASAYDCSGAASYVLQAAGALRSPMPSSGFRKYGESGHGSGSASTHGAIIPSSWSPGFASIPAGTGNAAVPGGRRRADLQTDR